jgi:DNA repair protein RadC
LHENSPVRQLHSGTRHAFVRGMSVLLSWIPDDRPRERLAAQGPQSLADAELVALLLGSGRPGLNAVEMGNRLISSVGGLSGLAQATVAELRKQPGIGAARAAVIRAAIELGVRVAGSRPERGRRLGTASEVWAHYRARLAFAPSEEFWVIGLDVRHRVLLEACIARGSLTGVEVHPREVFRPLIRASAAAALLCHNHPSGDPSPSRQDLELTARLKEVGELCGITVLDHVVVAAEGYASLAERGWM